MSEPATASGSRAVALYLTGFVAFVGLYLPQPILPRLAQDFGVSAQEASGLISATIVGIALASPLVGVVSDRFGRRAILIGSALGLGLVTLACALAPTFVALLAGRFVQGVMLPGLFAVGVAYVSEALPAGTMSTVAGVYVAATVVGGMFGRVLAGSLADVLSWRYGFGFSALLYGILVAVWARLPAGPATTSPRTLVEVARGTLGHLRDRAIVGGLLVGFCLFFAFQATFTYLPFRLARPPFSFSSTLIGLSYLTYTAGVFSSSFAGWFRHRASLRIGFVVGFALAIVGNLLALAPGFGVVALGLLVLCFGNWLVQGMAVGYVATAARTDRAGANALYLTLYYLGGSLGAYLPGTLFDRFGYGAVVGASVVALALGLASAGFFTGRRSAGVAAPRGG